MLITRDPRRKLFFILILLVITFSLREWPAEFKNANLKSKQALRGFPGLKFSGLEEALSGAQAIGYITDKDLAVKENQLQFSQAQYILAPIILEVNSLRHEFFLIDCTTEQKAFAALKAIGAAPLKKNQYGIILARKPHG
jgi:hypothetical protein